MHKTGELCLVIIGVVIDGLIFAGIDMGVSGPILGVILFSIIFMEIGSLMEIAAQLNPDLQAIKAFKLLSTVKENVDNEEDEIDATPRVKEILNNLDKEDADAES